MNRNLAVGTALTVGGVVGYVAGIATQYPGRAFSVAAVMVGLTLLVVGRAGGDAV
ncbi:hypothetical protein [Halostella pelagica]|uniref:hypothetical protein n=1 Tax=Halostella pelagica TaxID=2583824 RepID=UPI00143CDE19|nr:hypothetical protein [Halostella pelagica]